MLCVYCLDYAIVISDDDHDDVEDDAGDADNNLQEIQRLLSEILEAIVKIYNILLAQALCWFCQLSRCCVTLCNKKIVEYYN